MCTANQPYTIYIYAIHVYFAVSLESPWYFHGRTRTLSHTPSPHPLLNLLHSLAVCRFVARGQPRQTMAGACITVAQWCTMRHREHSAAGQHRIVPPPLPVGLYLYIVGRLSTQSTRNLRKSLAGHILACVS